MFTFHRWNKDDPRSPRDARDGPVPREARSARNGPACSGAQHTPGENSAPRVLWSRREAMDSNRVTRDVTARGVRMRVVEAGSGPPVVLIHDLLVSHLEFEDVMERLAPKYRVLAPDL